MRDIVFFLGAGFSCDAGLPVMSRFGEEADPKAFSLERLDREMTPELTKAAATYSQFRDLLVARSALSEESAGNIEKLFCVAEALREAGASSISLDGREVDLETIVTDLRTWIWKVYHQLPFHNERKKARTRLETYSAFIDCLKESGVASRMTVLTTNYDIVFEWVAHRAGLQCSYPLPSAEACAVGAGPERFATISSSRTDAVPILKLHGSINYFDCAGKDSPLLVAANISDGSQIAGRKFPRDIPAVVAVDALAQIRRDRGSEVVPAIVPPGYAKLVSTDWLRETWTAALKALQEAKAIVFIGYSMPPSDGLLSSVFAGSLGTRNSSRNRPAVYVIDPDPDVACRMHRVFGGRVRPSTPMSLRRAVDGELDRVLGDLLPSSS
jgi:NAD-dependent SIR2 family protein deacetylase